MGTVRYRRGRRLPSVAPASSWPRPSDGEAVRRQLGCAGAVVMVGKTHARVRAVALDRRAPRSASLATRGASTTPRAAPRAVRRLLIAAGVVAAALGSDGAGSVRISVVDQPGRDQSPSRVASRRGRTREAASRITCYGPVRPPASPTPPSSLDVGRRQPPGQPAPAPDAGEALPGRDGQAARLAGLLVAVALKVPVQPGSYHP